MTTNNDKTAGSGSFADDFRRRLADNRTSRWVRFAIVSLIFFLWVAWLGNWWVAIWWLLLADKIGRAHV